MAEHKDAAAPYARFAELIQKFGVGTSISAIIRVTSVFLSFLFFVVISNRTSTEHFGRFSVVFTFAMMAGYILNIGQHVAILRFWPAIDSSHGRASADRMLGRSLAIMLLGSALCLPVAIVLATALKGVASIGESFGSLLFGYILACAFAFSEFASSALRSKGHIVFAIAPRDIVWRILVIAFLLVTPVSLGSDQVLWLVSALLFAVTTPQLLVLLGDIWRHRKGFLPDQEKTSLQAATFPLWLSTSFTPIIDYAATVVVGVTLGPIAAGAYFAADRLSKLLLIALSSVELVAAPEISRAFHAKETARTQQIVRAASFVAFSAAALGFVVYFFLGGLALTLFDIDYASAYPVLLILAFGQLVSSACGPNAMLLNLAGRERRLLMIRVVWGSVAVLSGFIGAIFFGIIGAAVASTIVQIGWNFSASVVSWRSLGIWTLFLPSPSHSPGETTADD